jgi:hypothetical protein
MATRRLATRGVLDGSKLLYVVDLSRRPICEMATTRAASAFSDTRSGRWHARELSHLCLVD